MKKGRSTAARGHVARHILEQRIDDVEWCSMSDIPRRLKFPFHVKTVGWIVVGDQHFRGVHINYGTEFCVRLVSSDAVSEDNIGGCRYRTPFPHVMMKRLGELYEMRSKGWREAFFIIYPPELAGALRRAGVDDGPGTLPIWAIGDAPDVLESIREMRALFPRAAEPGVADELDARCWALVTRLVAIRDAAASASRDGADSSSAPHPDERLRAFSASLVSRCLKSIDFAAEARNLGYSRSVFYRRFTALVGEPPEKHLANLRLDAAARLLCESPLSIKQVAFAIHDKSPSHFAAAFKARFGVTPRAWRDGAMARDAQDSI